jgi:site-specific DNA-methyltransferase (adenine-specific)
MSINLHHGDCLAHMRTMPDNSVDAIVTDPPYFGVKDDDWDNQWKDAGHFIEWIGELSEQWQRILKPNGSLYCFASPRMAARVEMKIAERFDVLNRITWAKPEPTSEINRGAGNGGRVSKDSLRMFYPNTEAVIFAEHYGADNIAKGEASYVGKCDELRGFVFEPIRAYLDGERERAGVTPRQVNEATQTQMAGHWFTRVQWALPTAKHYATMQELFNGQGGDYLRTQYEDLRTQYEDLRTQYEDLRTQYEDLRRPFNVTPDVPYTDVWTFRTVQAYEGKHVCEKPLALMEHIILASTRPGAIVFDPFMGSGSTGVAAVLNGRSFIGCEMDAKHFANASARIQKHQAQPRLL